VLPSPDITGADDNGALAERIDGLAAWLQEMENRVHVAEVATGDEKTAKELRKAVEALAKHDPKLEDRVTNRVDVLADRLATLATTVSTTAASLAARDGEIVGLRRELDKGNTRIGALVVELGRVSGGGKDVSELRKAVETLTAERPARGNDRTVDELGRKVDFLSERVDTLAATVATTAAGLAGRDGELVTLRRKVDNESARIAEALAGTAAVRHDDSSAERIERVAQTVADATSRLSAIEGAMADLQARLAHGYERFDSTALELRDEVDRIARKLTVLDELPRAETVQALERRVGEAGSTLSAVATRLASLDSAVAAAADANAADEEEVAALGRRFEEASARVDLLVGDLQQALETMPPLEEAHRHAGLRELADMITDLGGRLELVEQMLSEQPTNASSSASPIEPTLPEVVERLTSLERERGAAAAELAHTTAFWSSELGTIETRLSELVQVHTRIEDLGTRIESREQEPTSIVDAHDVLARIDELAQRLESLEHVRGTPPASPPMPGDGRFRVELRGLELRMEHSEAASRENREAVLTQLERLASRVDWRLQRLEPERDTTASQAVSGGAEVVPIRSDDG
jgi:DNA repair exonuclease SbcCD ATPase subunit